MGVTFSRRDVFTLENFCTSGQFCTSTLFTSVTFETTFLQKLSANVTMKKLCANVII